MSSATVAYQPKESKLWACLKEVFWDNMEGEAYEKFAELGGRLIANAMGFHGDAAKAFGEEMGRGLVRLVQTISNINSGSATGWDLVAEITRTASERAAAVRSYSNEY